MIEKIRPPTGYDSPRRWRTWYYMEGYKEKYM